MAQAETEQTNTGVPDPIESPSGFDFRGFDVPNLAEAAAAAFKGASDGKGADKSGKKNKDKNGKKSKSGKGKDTAAPADAAPAAATPATEDKRPGLFDPIALRGLTVRNRIWLPPMDTYSAFARDGRPTPFHYQHYVSRALGGFGMVIVEATAVAPEGRISPCDVGLWEDWQIDSWRWIVEDIKKTGAAAAIQLNHAGRKGSSGCFAVGYEGETVPPEAGGWQTVAPSAIPFGGYAAPRALSVDEIHGLVGRSPRPRAVPSPPDSRPSRSTPRTGISSRSSLTR